MLSRLHAAGGRLIGLKPKLVNYNNNNQVICKRWSGHNAMNIEPSNYSWKHFKNLAHFYVLITMVPVAVITTIINIRANPELSEVPEGYEPRHWEYYKHPITRFMARYFFIPMEMEYEMMLSYMESESQAMITKKIQQKVEQTMKFHNDHRTLYFQPFFADYFRTGRDEHMLQEPMMKSVEGHFYDHAYDPKINPVPTEGYRPAE